MITQEDIDRMADTPHGAVADNPAGRALPGGDACDDGDVVCFESMLHANKQTEEEN